MTVPPPGHSVIACHSRVSTILHHFDCLLLLLRLLRLLLLLLLVLTCSAALQHLPTIC
jgi:hypothetical protein